MHRRILAPVAAAALAFGLVACTDTGGSGTVTTPPPSINIGGGSDDGGAEPSDGGGDTSDGGGDSPVAAPDIPAPDPADYPGMDQNTPEGAEQAFRYYVAVMIWGYQTGQTEHFETLHDPECLTCTTNARSIQQLAKNGKYWSQTSIEDIGTAHFDSSAYDFEVGYTFHLSAHAEPSPDSDTVTQEPRTKFISAAAMSFRDDQWVVMSARFTPDEEENG